VSSTGAPGVVASGAAFLNMPHLVLPHMLKSSSDCKNIFEFVSSFFFPMPAADDDRPSLVPWTVHGILVLLQSD
jgi:hypothetical protein